MTRIFAAWLLALSLLVPGASRAQNADDPFTRTLRPIVEQWMAQQEVPGLAVAIVQDGKPAYAGGFGVTRLGGTDKVTSRSLFHMGAISNTVTASAVMQLVERRQIELDAPVTTYLPYFRLADPRYGAITVRHLLGQTSGLPAVRDYEWNQPQADDGALERHVRGLSDVVLIAAPGERFFPSDLAVEVLGDLIAKVSGLSFETYVARNILEPLGMKDSTLLLREADTGLLTSPHVRGGGFAPVVSTLFPYNRRHAPSSTLYTNAEDMARWAAANLNRGALDDRRILERGTYDTMWTPVSDRSAFKLIGWYRTRDPAVIYQTGSDTGFSSHMVMVTGQSGAVVLMVNANYAGSLWPLMDTVLDVALRRAPRPVAVKPSVAKPLYATIQSSGVEAGVAQYRELKQAQPDAYDFSARELNTLATLLLDANRLDDALRIFALNVEVHPTAASFWSGNAYASVHDGLGEAYRRKGDRPRAIESFEASLKLDPSNRIAAEVLKTLR